MFAVLTHGCKNKCLWHCALALALVACGEALVRGQVLFDASQGSLPDQQGWTYGAFGAGTQDLVDGAALLDTTAGNSIQAGYSQVSPVALNRTNGFTLSFTARLLTETHANTNRAGFSVIVLDEASRGLELGFWTNRVFAQSDSPLFTHGEDTVLMNFDGYLRFDLSLFLTNYLLRANGTVVLSGPIRDYTAFNGLLNPYRTPNFIFLGDDTTSAQAAVSLRDVVLFTAPVLTVASPGVLAWSGVPGQPYIVETSSDLTIWAAVATVTSGTGEFRYTNSAAGDVSFLRVVLP